jgi:anhydro-N-acetylmuramic acid kinase
MEYRAIGLYSGNPATGLNIIFASYRFAAGCWSAELLHSTHYSYNEEWKKKLSNAGSQPAPLYCALHAAYGTYTGELVNSFIAQFGLQFKVALIASPGHEVFKDPAGRPVCLGEGARVAAMTRIPVISDFYALDAGLGGRTQNWAALLEKMDDGLQSMAGNAAIRFALMGVLRWRQEYNVFATDTGAIANSIGGAFWNGDEA